MMGYTMDLNNVFLTARNLAKERGLGHISSACLMKGITDNNDRPVSELLRSLGISPKDISAQLDKYMPQVRENDADFPNTFTEEATRILNNIGPEQRKMGLRRADTRILLLAILNDKDNMPKLILNKMGVEYTQVADIIRREQELPQNAFGYADDDAEEFPADSEKKSAGTQLNKEKNVSSGTPYLDKYGTNLTDLAAKGALDPVVGREKEIERMAQILARRKKNNPILIGQPGVGKSAVVEGLAEKIAANKVPHNLMGKKILTINMSAIVAGTQYRGQFEDRLQHIIQEVKSHPEIILFIDEIHTIIGAGGQAGSLDAANILKPALATGQLQCIGATTIEEYRKSVEKDGGLERRFQKILLEPSSKDETLTILHNIKGRYEDHHNVIFSEEALKACVDLTDRYVSDRALPDKAIDAMDETGSRINLKEFSVPKEVEEMEQAIDLLKKEKTQAAKAQNYEQAAKLRDEIKVKSNVLQKMKDEWMEQQKAQRKTVSADDVANVVSAMTGIPVQRVAKSENERLRGMKAALTSKVIAQDQAISKLTRAITRNRLGLKPGDRPVGTFLFVGPTGVGKTYLVKCLAEWMFGSEDALIRIDMSEYGEKHTTSRLVGSPPGYVGYEDGGQLTEKVRRHPYSVILLDEIEKAHPDVFNSLLQLMDEGRMTDGNGTTVDFRNTIIVMTSNCGTRQLKDFGAGIGFRADDGKDNARLQEEIIQKALRKQFAPEFLNRLDDIIMFESLSRKDAREIANLEMEGLKERMNSMGYKLELSDEARDFVINQGFNAEFGARSLKRAIQTHIEDSVCDLIMENTEHETDTIAFRLENDRLIPFWTH